MGNSLQKYSYPLFLFSAFAFNNPRTGFELKALQNTIKDSIPDKVFSQVSPHATTDKASSPGLYSKDVFVKVQLSKTNCFVGEPVMVTYKLYSCLNTSSKLIRELSAPGISMMTLPGSTDLSPSTELYKGRSFQVHTIRKSTAIPLVAGRLAITQLEMAHKLQLTRKESNQKHSPRELDDLLREINKEEASVHSLSIKSLSLPVSLDVHPLPVANVPPGFEGAIGKFSIRTELLTKLIKAGDPVKLRARITGFGNLGSTDAPVISVPSTAELINTRQTNMEEKANPQFETERIYEYTIIPHEPGKLKIPAISISYFDPEQKNYQTVQSAVPVIPVSSNVIKSKPVAGIKTKKRNPQLWIPMAILMLSLGAVLIFIRKRIVAKKLVAPPMDSPAPAYVEKLLAIQPLIEQGDISACQRLNDLLWNSFSEALNLKPTVLTRNSILEGLELKGWTGEERFTVVKLMDACEDFLYIPGDKSGNDLDSIYRETEAVVTRLHNS